MYTLFIYYIYIYIKYIYMGLWQTKYGMIWSALNVSDRPTI